MSDGTESNMAALGDEKAFCVLPVAKTNSRAAKRWNDRGAKVRIKNLSDFIFKMRHIYYHRCYITPLINFVTFPWTLCTSYIIYQLGLDSMFYTKQLYIAQVFVMQRVNLQRVNLQRVNLIGCSRPDHGKAVFHGHRCISTVWRTFPDVTEETEKLWLLQSSKMVSQPVFFYAWGRNGKILPSGQGSRSAKKSSTWEMFESYVVSLEGKC